MIRGIRRGLTLLEMMIAATLGVIIVLAMGQIDVTRIYLEDTVRRGGASSTEAAMAMMQMVRLIQQADRVIVQPDNLQLRIPTGGSSLDLDNAASYKWIQFRRDLATGQVLYFDPVASCTLAGRYGSCTNAADDACFSDLTFQYTDEATAPPGGDPNPQDNNVLLIELRWTDPKSGVTQRYVGEATLRAGAYSDVNASGADSGTGLAPSGIADPGGTC